MNLADEKITVWGLLTAVSFTALFAFYGYYVNRQMDEAVARVSRGHETLVQLESLLTTLTEVETGERGYLITGRPNFLDPYFTALEQVGEKIKRVRELAAANPNHQQRLRELDYFIAIRLGAARSVIEKRRMKGLEAAQEFVIAAAGLNDMGDIRRVIGDMVQEERRQLEVSEWVARASAGSAATIRWILLAAFAASSCALAYFFNHYLRLRRVAAQHLQQLTLYDVLTDLPNRSSFYERMNGILALVQRHDWMMAAMVLNLDDFKKINDTFGREAGDDLLRAVAQRLTSCVRVSDAVGRLGGDEFAIALAEIRSPQEAEIVAQKLINDLARPHVVRGHELNLTASIGVSLRPWHGDDTEILLKNAGLALLEAKKSGKNRFSVYPGKIPA